MKTAKQLRQRRKIESLIESSNAKHAFQSHTNQQRAGSFSAPDVEDC